MKVATATLLKTQLNYAVAMALGATFGRDSIGCITATRQLPTIMYLGGFPVKKEKGCALPNGTYNPSEYWSQGGPIIEREKLDVLYIGDGVQQHEWRAEAVGGYSYAEGPTPLIAAMRCFVAGKLGDEVDVPEELL
ncbi:DUF2591 domain-containing protein [Polaromonas sp. P1(28)-13]|nr:DUF2591 domain-containing protein [Polaromonas sp. P1(28)-13]